MRARPPLVSSCTIGALLLAASCAGEQASPNKGIAEPVRVESGQFVPGALPGSAPLSSGDGGVDPQVTDISAADTDVEQGELGLSVSGHATTDAQAIGMRFTDLGTGYWVVGVGAPDPVGQRPTHLAALGGLRAQPPPGIPQPRLRGDRPRRLERNAERARALHRHPGPGQPQHLRPEAVPPPPPSSR